MKLIAWLALLIATMSALPACAPTATQKYKPWDGPIEKLYVEIENTRRGLLELVGDDELYPIAVSILLGNEYARQRFDIVDSNSTSDCDYKIVIRFVNGSFSNVSTPSFNVGRELVKISGKIISVDLSGRVISCRTNRVLLSEYSKGSYLYIGNVNIDYHQLISTPGIQQVMEGTVTASKNALLNLIRKLMISFSRG